MKIIQDHEFIRNETPMTKLGPRILICGLLEISQGDKLLDIGMGTGSISVQAALMGAKVTGIDKSKSAIQISKANVEKFGVQIHMIHGQAPEGLEDMEIDKAFIGGSGGNLGEILDYLDQNLLEGGIVLGSFIITDNAVEFKNLLNAHGYRDIETRLVQISEENKLGMMMGQNPIYIIKGTKND